MCVCECIVYVCMCVCVCFIKCVDAHTKIQTLQHACTHTHTRTTEPTTCVNNQRCIVVTVTNCINEVLMESLNQPYVVFRIFTRSLVAIVICPRDISHILILLIRTHPYITISSSALTSPSYYMFGTDQTFAYQVRCVLHLISSVKANRRSAPNPSPWDMTKCQD